MKKKLITLITALAGVVCYAFAFAACGERKHADNDTETLWEENCDGTLYYEYADDGSCFVSGVYGDPATFQNGTLVIPDTFKGNPVKGIKDNAFYDCSGLTSVTISDGAEYIGNNAFYGCRSLTSITIPESVTNIGELAFLECTLLEEIRYTGDIKSWCEITSASGLVPFGNSERKLYIGGNEIAGDLVIPDGVTSIQDYAFADCTKLTSVTIPDSVTLIGWGAFDGCSRLESVTLSFAHLDVRFSNFGHLFGAIPDIQETIPASLKTVVVTGGTVIQNEMFHGCSGLTSISLPDGITAIHDHAFSGCSSLTGMEIPSSVTEIGYGAFEDCTGLKSITIPDSTEYISGSALCGCSGLESITLPFLGGSKDKTDKAHLGYIFGAVYTYDNPKYVPASLKTVTLTGGTSIATRAFEGCDALANVTLPDGVTSIGDRAFDGCSGLKNVTLPSSVTSINDSAFYGCDSLTGNEYGNACYLGNSENKYLYLIRAKDTSIISCTVHENVKSIYGGAFSGCNGLKTVSAPLSAVNYLPGGVIETLTLTGSGTLSKDGLKYFNALTELTVSDSVKMSAGALGGLGNLQKLTVGSLAGNGMLGMLFGTLSFQGAVAVQQYLYVGSSFRTAEYYIPASLEEVTLTKAVSAPGTFSNCTMLKRVTLCDEETTIGERTFYGCSGLEDFVLPRDATGIGSKAFEGCTALQTLQTNVLLQAIGTEAFKNCAALQSIALPQPFFMAGQNAFEGCTALERVTFSHTSDWGIAPSSAFTSMNVETTPVEVTDAEQNAENLKNAWLDFVLYNHAKHIDSLQ